MCLFTGTYTVLVRGDDFIEPVSDAVDATTLNPRGTSGIGVPAGTVFSRLLSQACMDRNVSHFFVLNSLQIN